MDIDFLRKFCHTLPAVTEDIKWGNDLCFSVGGKMFCVATLEPPFKASFKVRTEEFEELAAASGFMPAPYMARAGWIMVMDPSRLKLEEWQQRILLSYELTKAKLTRKQRAELGIDK